MRFLLRWVVVGLFSFGTLRAATVDLTGGTLKLTLAAGEDVQIQNPGADQVSFNFTSGSVTSVTGGAGALGYTAANPSTGTWTAGVTQFSIVGPGTGSAETITFQALNIGTFVRAAPVNVNLDGVAGDDVTISGQINVSGVATGTAFTIANAGNVTFTPGVSQVITNVAAISIQAVGNVSLLDASLIGNSGASITVVAGGDIIGDNGTSTSDIRTSGVVSLTGVSVGPAPATAVTDSALFAAATINAGVGGTVNFKLSTAATNQPLNLNMADVNSNATLTFTGGDSVVIAGGAVSTINTATLSSNEIIFAYNQTGGGITLASAATAGGFSLTSSATITLAAGITTSRAAGVTLNGNVALTTGAITIDSSTANGPIKITGTTDGAQALTLKAGTNSIMLQGNIGGTAALASLTATGGVVSIADIGGAATGITGAMNLTGTTQIVFAGTNFNANAQTYTSSGGVGAYYLPHAGGGVVIKSNNNPISFASGAGQTLDNTLSDCDLTIDAGTSTVSLPAVGVYFFANIDVPHITAATITLNGNVRSRSGDITLTGNVLLATGAITIDSTALLGNIGITGTINGAQNLTLMSGLGSVSLGGAIGGSAPPTGLSITTTGALALPAISLATSSNLSVTTTGAITQSGASIVPGTSSFSTGGAVITVNNNSNNFTGAVSLTNTGANNVAVKTTGALLLGTVSMGSAAAGTFTANAGAAITQSGVTTITTGTGLASFATGGSSILLTNANNFNSTSANGGVALNNTGSNNISVTAAGGLVLGTVQMSAGTFAGTFTANAGGPITQAAATAIATGIGAASITTGAFDITLTNANNFNSSGANGLALTNTGANNIAITSAVALNLAGVSMTSPGFGQLTITAPSTTQVSGNVVAPKLVLVGSSAGNFNIAHAGSVNNIGAIAATVTGTVSVTNGSGNPLAVGIGGTGISTSGSAVTLTTSGAAGEITLNRPINTGPGGPGGVFSFSGGLVINLANPIVLGPAGANITLNSSGQDFILNADLAFNNAVTISVTRDIILNAVLSTTGASSSITLTADSDNNNSGGVWVRTSSGATGKVSADDSATLTGSLIANAFSFTGLTANAGVQVDAGAATVVAGQNAAPTNGNIDINEQTSATGDVVLNGVVMSNTFFVGPHLSISDAGGAAQIKLGNNLTATAADILLFKDVVLTGPVTVGTGQGGVDFVGKIDGAQALTVNVPVGTSTFNDTVGGTTPLTSITTAAGGTVGIHANISTVSFQTYNDNVLLTNNVTLSNSGTTGIDFVSAVDSDGTATPRNLTLSTANAASTIRFDSPVGATYPLGTVVVTNAGQFTVGVGSNIVLSGTGGAHSFTQNGAGAVSLGGNITTAGGAIAFNAASTATLTNAVTLDSTNSGGTAAGGAITTGTVTGAKAFSLNAGTGSAITLGSLGSPTSLTTLTVTNCNGIRLSAVRTTGVYTINGNGTFNINGVLSGASGSVIQGGAGNDTFTIGAAGSVDHTIVGGGGTDTLVGPNLVNVWNITGANAGNITSVVNAFTGIANLTGGTNNDTFTFTSAGSVTGKVDGGSGLDIFNNSALASATITPTGAGTTDGVKGSATGMVSFDNINFPAITLVSPNAGPLAGGTSVTLTGTDFTGATAVKFGATAATTFTVNSATSITCTAPASGTVGAVNITVTTPLGTSGISVADQFSYGKNAQTIAFALATPVTYGVAPIALTGTATSGLALSFSVVSGPAMVSGSTLTVTGAGSIVIQADQAGSAAFTAAPSVQTTIVVKPATLTVTANNATRFAGSPNVLAATITGFVNNDTIAVVSGTPALSTTATTGSAAGTFPITVAAGTLSAANYNFAASTYVNGTLTVIPQLVTNIGSGGIEINAPSQFAIVLPAGSTTTVSWNFGDGATASGPSVSHPYSVPGTYQVTVTLTDSSGQSTSQTFTVTVLPTPFRFTGGTIKLSARGDTATLRGVLSVPTALALSGMTVNVNVGGNLASFAMNGKNRAASGGNLFRFGAASKMSSEVPFHVKLTGSLAAALKTDVPLDAAGFPTQVTTLIQFGTNYCSATTAVKFKATANGATANVKSF